MYMLCSEREAEARAAAEAREAGERAAAELRVRAEATERLLAQAVADAETARQVGAPPVALALLGAQA